MIFLFILGAILSGLYVYSMFRNINTTPVPQQTRGDFVRFFAGLLVFVYFVLKIFRGSR